MQAAVTAPTPIRVPPGFTLLPGGVRRRLVPSRQPHGDAEGGPCWRVTSTASRGDGVYREGRTADGSAIVFLSEVTTGSSRLTLVYAETSGPLLVRA